MSPSSRHMSAQSLHSDDETSFQIGPFTKPPRPDFSSTSEDEAEEAPFEVPKLSIKSHAHHSPINQIPPKSRMLRQSMDLDDEPEDVAQADLRIIKRFYRCLQTHRPYDMHLPKCQRCKESGQKCIYARRKKAKLSQPAPQPYVGPRRSTPLRQPPAEN